MTTVDNKRKICFITGSRAEYGLLSRLMQLVKQSPDCEIQIIATNMHLLPEFGYTYREIEHDGLTIDRKVYMKKPSDDAHGVVDSMVQEMGGMNEAIRDLAPDMLVILGDRYEMLVAATIAMLYRVPIAHLHGGELTVGAYDDSIRHCITKLSNLHFASTEEYRQRILQLGEEPDHVFNMGAIGVENIKKVPQISRQELEKELGYEIHPDTVLCTYHPVTLGDRSAKDEIDDFLGALDDVGGLHVIFTLPNSDQGSDYIRQAIEKYCAEHADTCHCHASLGLQKYLSLMHNAIAVIGNSSSGIIEVPSMHIPTLNIGDRQKGRAHGESVVDCRSDRKSIVEGLRKVLSPEFREFARTAPNPYDKDNTAEEIFKVISQFPLEELRQKAFFDMK